MNNVGPILKRRLSIADARDARLASRHCRVESNRTLEFKAQRVCTKFALQIPGEHTKVDSTAELNCALPSATAKLAPLM